MGGRSCFWPSMLTSEGAWTVFLLWVLDIDAIALLISFNLPPMLKTHAASVHLSSAHRCPTRFLLLLLLIFIKTQGRFSGHRTPIFRLVKSSTGNMSALSVNSAQVPDIDGIREQKRVSEQNANSLRNERQLVSKQVCFLCFALIDLHSTESLSRNEHNGTTVLHSHSIRQSFALR